MSAAQTKYGDDFVISGTLEIYSPSNQPIGFPTGIGLPFQEWEVSIGPAFIRVSVSSTTTHDGTLYYELAVEMDGQSIPGGDIIEMEGDDDYHLYNWSITFEGALYCEVTEDPLGEKAGVTHSKEVKVEDTWKVDGGNTNCTFGSVSYDNTYSSAFTARLNISSNHAFNSLYTHPENQDYLRMSMYFNQAEVDCSQLSDAEEPDNKYSSYYTHPGREMFIDGNDSSIIWSIDDELGTCKNIIWSGWVKPAHHHTFTGIDVVDMDLDTIGSLELWGRWQVYDASSATWSYIKKSVSSWIATEYVEDYGLYSWDSTDPHDNALRFISPASWYIDNDSAKSHGLRGVPSGDDFKYTISHNIDTFDSMKGCYWEYTVYNGEMSYTNGYWFIYYNSTYGWSVGQGISSPPHYVVIDPTVDTPDTTYMVNTTDFDTDSNPDWEVTDLVSVSEVTNPSSQCSIISPATPGFEHDLTCIILGWLLSCTDRESTPTRTDIAAITHDNSISIYADALDHTSWSSENGTTVDISGNFTIPPEGDTLTLNIPNNWIDRVQTHIPAQDGVGGPAPNGYMYMKHDVYWNHATTPETIREGVYCWLGWRYLYIKMLPPDTTDVTLKIYYYYPTISENHKTDSTRQTELTVDLGSLQSRTITAGILAQPDWENADYICFDMADIELDPIFIVDHIELVISESGDWSMGDPLLREDEGEAYPDPDRLDPSYHADFKHFEHSSYAKGGFSGHSDGQHREALYWLDDDHANTIEKTGGNFSYRVGAKTGIDMSEAWSLQGIMTIVENCSDAWFGSFSSSNHDDATKDAAGTRLKVLSATDIKPVCRNNVDSDGGVEAGIRCKSWDPVRGLKYDWHVYKIVYGAIHGYAEDNGEVQRNEIGATSVFKRLPSNGDYTSWTELSSVSSDDHALLVSNSYQVYELDSGVLLLRDYGLGSVGSVSTKGRWADREYDAANAPISGGGDIDIDEMFPEVLFLSSIESNIEVTYSQALDDFWRNGPPSGAPGDNPKDTGIEASSASIRLVDSTAEIVLVYERSSNIYGSLSKSFGQEMGSESMIISGGQYPNVDGSTFNDIVHIVYYKDGSLRYARVDTNSWIVSKDAEAVSDVPAQRAGISVSDTTNKIVIVYRTTSGIESALSKDGGDTWTTSV